MSLTTFINDRPIQTKAFNEVTKLLQTRDECLVKMFCGTGKSRVIQRIILERKHPLSVVVFPSLALIRQFTTGYLGNVRNICLLNVSSEELAHITSTTDPAQIHHFLNNPKTKHQQKIICVTYQSLDVLLSSIGDTKIGIACFDEAHRTTSENAVKLVYGDEYRAKYEKRVFFTATPVNANGITMFDRERDEMRTYGDCGPLAYEYTYLQGLRDGYLSLFKLRIDLYTQDTLGNMYESIARAILTTGNTRVLTFHADAAVESDSETSVLRFVDKAKFVEAFRAVCAKEFPEKVGMFADERITFRAITATTKDKDAILGAFETCSDTEIYIVSSCRTIGEGVDTKKANMCVFVDPKSSPKDIIQNIGRICRKSVERQPATVLIPVCIGWEKYRKAGDDPEAQDKLIREQLNDRENGDYNAIMNVCAALKQEDHELYELCLKYPSNFTESERKHALEEQKKRNDPDDYVYRKEIDELVENGERVEIHTSNTEQPIIYQGFNEEEDDEEDERPIQRFYEVEEENDDGEMETRYHRIVPLNDDEEEDEEAQRKRLNPPKATNRPRMNIHTNDEIKLLWKMGDVMLGEQFGSGVLECEVERMNWDEKLLETISYVKEFGTPWKASNKKNTNNKKISSFITGCKRNYNENIDLCTWVIDKEKRHEIYTKEVINNKDICNIIYPNNSELWNKWFEELKNYVEKNKKRPSQRTELGIWFITQQKAYNTDINKIKGNPIVKDNHAKFTEFLETYGKYLCIFDLQWDITLKELDTFIEKHKRKPSSQVSNKILLEMKDKVSKEEYTILLENAENEKKLEKWSYRQTENYKNNEGKLGKNMYRKKWEEFRSKHYNIAFSYEDKFLNYIEGFKQNIDELKKFINRNNKRPRKEQNIKKNISEKEINLGQFTGNHNNRYDARGPEFSKGNIMKNPEVWQMWNKMISDPKYKNYFINDKVQDFMEDISKMSLHIEKTGKAPRQSGAGDPEEKRLGIFVSHKKKNYDPRGSEYSKEVMKTPEIWQIWTETIQKYPCLKKQGQETPSPPPSPPIQETSKPKPKPRLVIKKSHLIPNPSTTLECSAPETNSISNPSTPKRVITDSPYKLTGRAWSSQKSTTTHEKLRSNPAEWHAYHAARDVSFQGYTDQSQIPRNRIIAHLANKRKHRLRVLDLGCGRNNIAQHYADADKDHKFAIQGYDHVVEEGSTARVGNIADLAAQEDDESADICIYSQSLMGSDWRDYLKEGHRVLRYNGEFIISEHIKMLDDVRAELGRLGCKIESEAADASDPVDKVAKWFVLVARKV